LQIVFFGEQVTCKLPLTYFHNKVPNSCSIIKVEVFDMCSFNRLIIMSTSNLI